MEPIIAYIVGCVLGGLYGTAPRARCIAWILAVSALLCALYLAAVALPLPGFSGFAFKSGAPIMGDGEPPWIAPIPGIAGLVHLADATLASAFKMLQTLGESTAAARVGFALYLLGAVAILARPLCGLYLMLFGALVGDAVLLPWYPFVKGFSSPESLFFIHDAFIVSPLEVYIVLTAISWALWRAREGELRFRTGPLFWPGMVFAAALLFGLAYGGGNGGDLRIALWEARGVFYLVPLILLTRNIAETPATAKRLLGVALAAVFIKGVVASLYYLVVLRGDLNGVESIAEHGAAIHLNAIFLAAFAVWLYETSRLERTALLLALPFVALGYLAMQRRAAFVTATIACLLLLAFLYRRRRRLFWVVTPVYFLASVAYVAAAGDSPNTLALPAHTFTPILRLREVPSDDRISNDDRALENRNIGATIREHPLLGIGFGRKYTMAVPQRDLTTYFEWWEYIPHNSIMWIWMKAGIVGFLSLLCLIGLALASGARAAARSPRDDLGLVLLTATLYFAMHFVYACVDMSWDPASIVFVGVLMGLLGTEDWLPRS